MRWFGLCTTQHGESWEIRESDLKLLLGTVHDLMLVVALLVKLTAKQDKTAEERMRFVEVHGGRLPDIAHA